VKRVLIEAVKIGSVAVAAWAAWAMAHAPSSWDWAKTLLLRN
jgi:hypothetical protein